MRKISQMNLWDSASALITMSLGKNPMNGGRPPSENRAKKHSILVGGFGMRGNCLRWNI